MHGNSENTGNRRRHPQEWHQQQHDHTKTQACGPWAAALPDHKATGPVCYKAVEQHHRAAGQQSRWATTP
eukprot:9384705-Alexandrium_andersonii.AAC.1